MQALLAAVKGPSQPEREEPAAPAEKRPRAVEQPTLPVRIEVGRISFTIDSLEIVEPARRAQIDKLGLQARSPGEGQTLSLDLWCGLGDSGSGRRPLPPRDTRRRPFHTDRERQRFGLALRSSGLGDLDLRVRLDAETHLQGDRSPTTIKSMLEVATTLDLIGQRFSLETFTAQLGQGTRIEAVAKGEEILVAPKIRLEALAFRSDLAELAPLVAALAPDVVTTGRLRASVAPFDVVTDRQAMNALARPSSHARGCRRRAQRHGDVRSRRGVGLSPRRTVRCTCMSTARSADTPPANRRCGVWRPSST